MDLRNFIETQNSTDLRDYINLKQTHDLRNGLKPKTCRTNSDSPDLREVVNLKKDVHNLKNILKQHT